jgi:twitching motility two-component system response regulator PilH
MSTVMVVDDSPTLRVMISDLLTKHGLQVIEAHDGMDAQEKMRSTLPDLVIMDVVMPRMNGYELCRWVKGEITSRKIPVIMCTTKSEEFDRHWGMKQGVDAYITKPFEPQQLMAIVNNLLEQA